MKKTDIVWILSAAAIAAALLWIAFSHTLTYAYEDVRYQMNPTPARAFAYGEKHFDAANAARYDIGRAEYFLNKAATDPSLPYVYHELARISFLRGDFSTALSRINLQISLHGTTTPNSYYVRGLIEGFIGMYGRAAEDYRTYMAYDPTNWAATNDLAWVLLKGKRYSEALTALEKVLPYWPENPWLINSKATALFELGRLDEAKSAAAIALQSVIKITEKDWLQAYPGNDPLIAKQGMEAFQAAVLENMHTIELALEKEK